MKKVWLLAPVFAFVLSPFAHADKEKKRRGVDVFARYDVNHNGVLDPEEKEAIRKAFATDPDLKPYDTNGDGKLDENEIAAIKPLGKKKKKNS
jgi:hypothetical protein